MKNFSKQLLIPIVKKKESEVTQWCLTLCDPHGLVAYQAPASMGFSRQEYWSGLPFPSPGDLLDPGIEPRSQHCRQTLYHLSQQGRLPVVNYFANLNIHLKFWSMFIKPDSQTEITHVRNNYPGDFWFQTLKAKINNSMEEIKPGKSTLNTLWKDGCWSWSSNTLAIWFEQLTHWKRPWSWERLKAEEKGTTEDETVGWLHRLDGHELGHIPDGERQGNLACCSPSGLKEPYVTWQLNNNKRKTGSIWVREL